MKEFKLTLNVNDVNLILKALGNLPYNQVNELVSKIHAQAQQQMNGEVINGAKTADKV